MKKWLKWGLLICAFITLIPLCVDQFLGIEVSHYTLRINYLGFAGILLFALWAYITEKAWNTRVHKEYFKRLFPYLFLAMGLIGLIGVFGSENPKRSLIFTIWTVGTLVTLPLGALFLQYRFGQWVMRVLAVYFAIHCLILVIDAVACGLTGFGALGRVLIVTGIGCRPHGFYQEPNYFAAFGLLFSVLIRIALADERNQRWRHALGGIFLLSLLAVFLSSSKMGIVGVLAILVLEGVKFFFQRISGKNRSKLRLKEMIGLGACFIGILLVAVQNRSLQESLMGVSKLWSLGGTQSRLENALGVVDLVVEYPVWGVGPGGSGAYIVKHGDRLPRVKRFLDSLPPERKRAEGMRNDPYFYNFFSELFAEWGIMGSLFFLGGLLSLLAGLKGFDVLLASGVFMIVAGSWQTLPRFDLWTCFALLYARNAGRLR